MNSPIDDPTRDDYLWDGSGAPDEEVVRLETVLAPYRHRGTLPALPPRQRERRDGFGARPPARRVAVHAAMLLLMTAASLLLVAGAAWFAYGSRQSRWTVQSLAGAPSVAGARIDSTSRLPTGEVVTTDAASRARIAIASVGYVDVDPNSRLRLMPSRAAEHRMTLDRGQIRAVIWAPAGQFFVNTPAATAVDLGCIYRLQVDDRGWGRVHVESGWVAFEYDKRESFIPTDAMCATRPGFGPGTPCYEDAPAGMADALTILDFSSTRDVRRRQALDTVLAAARPKDALTLWHLLSRGTQDERVRVYDRLASLVPPPPSATRENVMRGDQRALDDWWNSLGLDSASWWRIWKRKW